MNILDFIYGIILLIFCLIFSKDNISKNSRQLLVLILLSSAISLIPFVFFNNLLVSISICHWNLHNITTHNFALSCIFYRSMQETSQIWHNLPVCNIFWLRYSIWQWCLKNSWHKNKTTDMQIENTIEKLQAKTRAHGTLSVAVSRSPVYS